MLFSLLPWLPVYLLIFSLLLLPVVLSYYGPRVRRLAGRIRSRVARLKRQVAAALRRRLWRWLTEPTAGDPQDAPPPATPLQPRP